MKIRNNVSNALIGIFGTIVVGAMVVFGKVYTQEGIFVINNSMDKTVRAIVVSMCILLGATLYNSVMLTVIVKKYTKMTEDLSDAVELFFATYLRKEKKIEKSIERIREIAERNGIEGDE